MESNTNTYIKTDDNILINEKTIRWMRKMDDCIQICNRKKGCFSNPDMNDKHKVCKYKSPESYDKLNALFE
jgi:hypothetical protein